MYQSIADEFAVKIENLSDKTNISSILKTQYLREYQKELADQIGKLNWQIESNIKNGMSSGAVLQLQQHTGDNRPIYRLGGDDPASPQMLAEGAAVNVVPFQGL